MGNLLKSDVSIQTKLLMFGFCSDLPSLRQGSGVQGAHRKHLWVCRQKRWCISSITINVSTAYNFLTVFFITSFCGYGCHDPCLSPLFKKDLPNRASISTGICQQPWAVGYVFVLASSVLLVILCLNHNVISNINIYITYIYIICGKKKSWYGGLRFLSFQCWWSLSNFKKDRFAGYKNNDAEIGWFLHAWLKSPSDR